MCHEFAHYDSHKLQIPSVFLLLFNAANAEQIRIVDCSLAMLNFQPFNIFDLILHAFRCLQACTMTLPLDATWMPQVVHGTASQLGSMSWWRGAMGLGLHNNSRFRLLMPLCQPHSS
jgi:hypothetical protein